MGCDGCANLKIINRNDGSFHVNNETLDLCNKLNTYDWLHNMPANGGKSNIIEVRFKNTRKEFCSKSDKLLLHRGDIVVIGASPGYDVGVVSLLGYLAEKQFKIKVQTPERYTLNHIFRKANALDIEKWEEAKKREYPTMIKARQIAEKLDLKMKISDVEFQGDNRKAIFYYTAKDKINYRELIKLYLEEFKVRVEMKQIGIRQEAGRVGGIGSCGRELCCSTWRTDLKSVPVSSAIKQNLTHKAERLAGQCGKLKCCLMYELEAYLESWEDFPEELLQLETTNGTVYRYKVDVLKKIIWYTYTPGAFSNLIPIAVDNVKDIIMKNKKGIKVDIDHQSHHI